MTQPYRYSKGGLGQFAGLAAGQTFEFQDVKPDTGATELALYLRTSLAGRLRVERVDDDPTIPRVTQRTIKDVPIATPVAPDDDEVEITIPSPAGVYRLFFTADIANVGQASGSARATWNGGNAIGWPYEER